MHACFAHIRTTTVNELCFAQELWIQRQMVGVLRHSFYCKWVTISRFAQAFKEKYNIELDAEVILELAKTNPRFNVWEEGEEPQIRSQPKDCQRQG